MRKKKDEKIYWAVWFDRGIHGRIYTAPNHWFLRNADIIVLSQEQAETIGIEHAKRCHVPLTMIQPDGTRVDFTP